MKFTNILSIFLLLSLALFTGCSGGDDEMIVGIGDDEVAPSGTTPSGDSDTEIVDDIFVDEVPEEDSEMGDLI